jgi:hypothetical protein
MEKCIFPKRHVAKSHGQTIPNKCSASMDRHEREARITMILVSLPLPPVPVLACRGEDVVDSVCSSHDLHAVMMATDMQRVRQGAVTQEQYESFRLRKCMVLDAMQDKMRAVLTDAAVLEDNATCVQCYATVCEAIRKYWALYAHECADVRVCGIDSVVKGDLVYEHMLAYVRANLGVEPGEADMQSYSALFKFWLLSSFIKSV